MSMEDSKGDLSCKAIRDLTKKLCRKGTRHPGLVLIGPLSPPNVLPLFFFLSFFFTDPSGINVNQLGF